MARNKFAEFASEEDLGPFEEVMDDVIEQAVTREEREATRALGFVECPNRFHFLLDLDPYHPEIVLRCSDCRASV